MICVKRSTMNLETWDFTQQTVVFYLEAVAFQVCSSEVIRQFTVHKNRCHSRLDLAPGCTRYQPGTSFIPSLGR